MVGISPKWWADFGGRSVGGTPTDAAGTAALPAKNAQDSGWKTAEAFSALTPHRLLLEPPALCHNETILYQPNYRK
jgi:hypothetical protein